MFERRLPRRLGERVVRCCDVVLAALLAVLLSPLLVVAAAAVLAVSGRPVLYWQERIGRGRRAFRIVKFRTMVPGADGLRPEFTDLNEAEAPLFKIRGDPRITSVGRVLRRHGIDELPQLWNILRGDMTFVGPRPITVIEDSALSPSQLARYDRLPGITGAWQITEAGNQSVARMAEIDLAYQSTGTVRSDLKIAWRTIAIALRGAVE